MGYIVFLSFKNPCAYSGSIFPTVPYAQDGGIPDLKLWDNSAKGGEYLPTLLCSGWENFPRR